MTAPDLRRAYVRRGGRLRPFLGALRRHPWDTLRTMVWAARAVGPARRQMRRNATEPLELPTPPRAAAFAEVGILAVLRLSGDKCLMSSSLRQAWLHEQGVDRDMVIGVAGGTRDFRAHAWLEGDPPGTWRGYEEIARRRFGEPLGAMATSIESQPTPSA